MSPTVRQEVAMPAVKKHRGPKQQRSSRSDGEVTRARIIDIAGRLFAQNGYGETTSKEISEQADINMAAINYHFGSRENLYLAVLEEADRRLVDLDSSPTSTTSATPRKSWHASSAPSSRDRHPPRMAGQLWVARCWRLRLLPVMMQRQCCRSSASSTHRQRDHRHSRRDPICCKA